MENNIDTNTNRPWTSGSIFPQLNNTKKTDVESAANDDQGTLGVKSRKRIHKLDAILLTKPQGIPWLKENGSKMKFHGSQNPRKDLRNILSFYQVWCHQLFPKLNFRDCVQQVEKVAKSNVIKHYMTGWKGGDSDPAGVNRLEAFGLDGLDLDQYQDTPIDFSGLNLDDQSPHSPNNSMSPNYDNIPIANNDTEIQPNEEPSNMDQEFDLTEEQLAIIEANRRRALERLERRKMELQMQESQKDS